MSRISVIAALALLTGCAGTPFQWDRAKEVKIGTTEAELVALLGKPNRVATRGDSQVWVWAYANGLMGSVRTVSFPLKDGKVTALPNLSQFD